jgi:anti-anti-sigma factor
VGPFSGDRLWQARLAAELAREDLAQRAGVQLADRIRDWERGAHAPQARYVARLAAALGVDPVVLYDVDPARPPLRVLRLARGVSLQQLAELAGATTNVPSTPERQGRPLISRSGMTTATGTREIPFGRPHVWRSLTNLTPYCSVCDVSYVFDDSSSAGQAIGKGSRFVCVPGRLEGAEPPPNAVAGEVVEWAAQRCIETRLELASETWQTQIELADAEPGSTSVTVTVTREPKGGSRLLHSLQRRSVQRMVQRTVDSELAKLPAHINGVAEDHIAGAAEVWSGAIAMEREAEGWVLHLRGEVDAAAVRGLELERRLEDVRVVVIDVTDLTYLDSIALPPLRRWAKAASRAGQPPLVRGVNQDFDRMLGVMGMTSVFQRAP